MKLSVIITVALAILFASPAMAKEPAEKAPATALDAKLARADKLYREGNELFDKRELEAAVEKYKAAFSLKPAYDIAGNLGAVELALKRYVDAAEHVAFSLRIYPVNAAAERREESVGYLKLAVARIGTLRIEAPEGAQVTLDGKVLGNAPLEHEVYCEPGRHVLEAHLEGHASTTTTVNPKVGEEVAVALPKGVEIENDPNVEERSYAPEIVFGALGVASIVTGAVLYGLAVGVDSDAAETAAALPDGTPCDFRSNVAMCAPIGEDADSAYALSGAGIGMFAVGGAALVAGVLHFAIVGTGEGEDAGTAMGRVRVSPMLGAVNGLQLSGSF